MRSLIALVALFSWFPTVAVAQVPQGAQAEKLRQFPQFPIVSCGDGFEFNPVSGWSLEGIPPDVDGPLDALKDPRLSQAERYAGLGRLLQRCNCELLGRLTHAGAAAIYREQSRTDPNNPSLLVALGIELHCSRQCKEADTVLHRACQLAPGDWKAWTALGDFLAFDLVPRLLDFDGAGPATSRRARELVMANKVPRANVEKAQQALKEALACLEQAVALAPRQADVYQTRAVVRFRTGETGHLLRLALGEPVGPFAQPLTRDVVDDLLEMAKLNPSDSLGLAGAIYFQWMALQAEGKGPVSTAPRQLGLEDMPPTTQATCKQLLAELEKRSAGSNPREAGEAAEALAFLQWFVLGDLKAAEAGFRKSLALNPYRGKVWNFLTVIINYRPQERMAVCQERLKHDQSADAYFFLAYAHADLHQWDKAEEHVRTAIRLDPQHVNAHLGLAAALLRRADRPEVVREAGAVIDRLLALDKEKPGNVFVAKSALSVVGIYRALLGETVVAAQCFEGLLKFDPNDLASRMALHVLLDPPDDEAALRAAVRLPALGCCKTLLVPPQEVRGGQPLAKNLDPAHLESLLKSEKWQEVEQQLRLGLRAEPLNHLCNLGLAALLLKRGTDLQDLGEANSCLFKVFVTENQETRADYLLDARALRAIVNVLMGQGGLARQQLAEVLTADPDHEMARAVVRVLDSR